MSIAAKDLPPHEAMVENIVYVFEQATATDVAEGLAWYDEARGIAQALAAGSPYTVEQCAGVIAVISPRLAWSKNAVYPSMIIDYHRKANREVKTWRDSSNGKGMSVTHKNRKTALAILDGTVDPLDVLGKKTQCFYRNILGDPDVVTVDSWATKVAFNNPHLEDNPSNAAYDRIAAAYLDAANRLGISARALQAATWVAFRNAHNNGKVR